MPKSDDREKAPKAKSEKAKLQTTFLTKYDQSKLLAVAPDILSGESVKRKVLKAIDDAPMFGFPLPDSKQLPGSGIYLIYYFGDSTLLQGCASALHPVYVGAAYSQSKLMGAKAPQYRLYRRLRAHQTSLEHSTGLDVKDFGWKAIPLDDMVAEGAEKLILGILEPVLNNLGGFGTNSDRTATNFDAIWDRPGNQKGIPRDLSGHLAELYEKAMVQLDKSVGKQVSATAALEKAGSLYEVYLSIRAVWRQSEKELNLSKTDVN